MEILASLLTLKLVLKSISCIYVCIYATNRCFKNHIKKLNVFPVDLFHLTSTGPDYATEPIWYLDQLIKHVHYIKSIIKNIYPCLSLSYLVDSCSVIR